MGLGSFFLPEQGGTCRCMTNCACTGIERWTLDQQRPCKHPQSAAIVRQFSGQPPDWNPLLEGLLRSLWGGSGGSFRKGGLNFLKVALVWKFPYGSLPKQSSKKFASEPPKLLRSPSRSGPMRKLVAELSYIERLFQPEHSLTYNRAELKVRRT